MQVLTVPFYAWANATSSSQRTCYLQALLGASSSHLATSQATALEPICRVPGVRIAHSMLPKGLYMGNGARSTGYPPSPFALRHQQLNTSGDLGFGSGRHNPGSLDVGPRVGSGHMH